MFIGIEWVFKIICVNFVSREWIANCRREYTEKYTIKKSNKHLLFFWFFDNLVGIIVNKYFTKNTKYSIIKAYLSLEGA
jgi:hypothetical protein